jgi:hypothetical protein
MRRALSILVVVRALACISGRPLVRQATAIKEPVKSTIQTPGAKVTIVFRGLMIFQPDSERRYLGVGILNAVESKSLSLLL